MSSIFQPEILRIRASHNQYHQVFVNVKHTSLKYCCLHILTHIATFCFLVRSILSGTVGGEEFSLPLLCSGEGRQIPVLRWDLANSS